MGEVVGVLKGVPFQKILVCVMKYGISAYGGDHVPQPPQALCAFPGGLDDADALLEFKGPYFFHSFSSSFPPPLMGGEFFDGDSLRYTVRWGNGISIPSSLNRLNILFLSSCWARYWSTNSLTWHMRVKSRELSPKPGMNLTKGSGSARRP